MLAAPQGRQLRTGVFGVRGLGVDEGYLAPGAVDCVCQRLEFLQEAHEQAWTASCLEELFCKASLLGGKARGGAEEPGCAARKPFEGLPGLGIALGCVERRKGAHGIPVAHADVEAKIVHKLEQTLSACHGKGQENLAEVEPLRLAHLALEGFVLRGRCAEGSGLPAPGLDKAWRQRPGVAGDGAGHGLDAPKAFPCLHCGAWFRLRHGGRSSRGLQFRALCGIRVCVMCRAGRGRGLRPSSAWLCGRAHGGASARDYGRSP